MSLVRFAAGPVCKVVGCGKPHIFFEKVIGCTLVCRWKCSSGHKGGRWASSSRSHDMYANNLIFSAPILLSGNNYSKIALLGKCANLHMTSKSTFHRTQRRYVAPAINLYWQSYRQTLIVLHALKEVQAWDCPLRLRDLPTKSTRYVVQRAVRSFSCLLDKDKAVRCCNKSDAAPKCAKECS